MWIAFLDGVSDDWKLIQVRGVGLIELPKEVRQIRRCDDGLLTYECDTI